MHSFQTHLCSIPRCALMLAYQAVPVRFLSSLYGMCCLVLLSLYFLAKPKSIRNNFFHCCPVPIRKLSGLMSLCIKFFVCTYSILLIIWKKERRRENQVKWFALRNKRKQHIVSQLFQYVNHFSRSQVYFINFI